MTEPDQYPQIISPVESELARGVMAASDSSEVTRTRISAYTALGASVGAVPLPWLPNMLLRRIRGALVYDIAVRRGFSLARDARDALANPDGPAATSGVFSQALHFFGIRLVARMLSRFGPSGVIWPAQAAVRTYVLGRAFDRYLRFRDASSTRIDVDEARRIRRAIDATLAGAIGVKVPHGPELAAIDDERDTATAIIDGMLGAAAGLPAHLLVRLDCAFDHALAQIHD
jgi:uncharacterized protein (DUF697 family)